MKLICIIILCMLYSISSAHVLITFAGDLNASVIPDKTKDTDKIFKSVHDIFSNDNLTIVNLECPISDKGKAIKDKQFTFRAKPTSADKLKKNGIDVVSIANNHSLDFGPDAFTDTLANLNKAGIKFSGGGRNSRNIINPVIKIKNSTIKLISASRVIPSFSWTATPYRPGLNTIYNPDKTIAEIKMTKKSNSQIIIAYIHWGEEKSVYPNKVQKKLAHQLIDAGADFVVGSHPHVLQGFEWYKGKLIAYSLGNFIFSCSKRNTMLIQLSVDDNKIISAKVIPMLLANKTPLLLIKEKEQQKVYTYLTEISENAIVDTNGIIVLKKLIQNK